MCTRNTVGMRVHTETGRDRFSVTQIFNVDKFRRFVATTPVWRICRYTDRNGRFLQAPGHQSMRIFHTSVAPGDLVVCHIDGDHLTRRTKRDVRRRHNECRNPATETGQPQDAFFSPCLKVVQLTAMVENPYAGREAVTPP